ncbi:MAG: 3-alpha,7-alpha,12-alpha-trihydroxy-5-beta-cholest-24-enoyl-CoA hydratase [Gammaproteobacteria bacterium]
MPIDYEHLMSLRTRGERVQYTDRDTLLYALGVGLGRDPGNRPELPFLSDPAGLKTLPTLASVLVGNRLLDDCGWNAAQVVLREERVGLERPIEEAGVLLMDSDVASVLDRGAEGGALVTVETRARRERDGQPMFTVRRTWLARRDGGFGGPQGRNEGGSVAGHPLPQRRPDMTRTFETRPDQAFLFRLSLDRGDLPRNPAARRPDPPALDGLCLQGIACLAILSEICEYDHTLIRSLSAALAGPASPGETLVAELWQDANVVSCRLRVPERDAVVLDQGRCVLVA